MFGARQDRVVDHMAAHIGMFRRRVVATETNVRGVNEQVHHTVTHT